MLNNVSSISDCYGCGVCSVACPKNIINIELNNDGFYQPIIPNNANCIDCGICLKVCAFSHKDVCRDKHKFHGYAAWSVDEQIRKNSSSGGVCYTLGLDLLNKGYKICGVKYNAIDERAEHFIATSPNDLKQTLGSKYIQSYTVNAFSSIPLQEKHFVIGTPCQIDSFRRYIQLKKKSDNFILMDFFCHGVPSMLMWKKYLDSVKVNTKTLYPLMSQWRHKQYGWHNSWCIKVYDKEAEIHSSLATRGDIFYQMFLGHHCMSKACYDNCKYKQANSAADIRCGDFWGNTYKDDEKGTSSLIVLTEVGNKAIKECADLLLVNHDVDTVMEGQLVNPIKRSRSYTYAMKLLKSDIQLDKLYFKIKFRENTLYFHKKLYAKLKYKIYKYVKQN